MPRAQLRRAIHHRVATQGLIGAFTLIGFAANGATIVVPEPESPNERGLSGRPHWRSAEAMALDCRAALTAC